MKIKYVVLIIIIILIGLAIIQKTNSWQNNPGEWPVEKLVDKMSLKEKIGQMMITQVYGYEEDSLKSFINKNKIGGVIYFYEDTRKKNKESIRLMSSRLQSYSKIPLFIAADIEGGKVNRLIHLQEFPSAKSYGEKYIQAEDKEKFLQEFRKNASFQAQLLKDVGINVNFAPLLDLVENNSNLGLFSKLERSYSSDPEIVALLGGIWIEELQKNNILATAKHFPGHGHTDIDSHEGIARITKNISYLENNDLIPFKEAIRKDVSFVMTGYFFTPYDNSTPAPYSKNVTELLRGLGYDGILLPDDFGMPPVKKQDHVDMAIKAVKAGNDMILNVEIQNIHLIIEGLVDAVKEGKISEEQIDESVMRVLKAKRMLGLV